MNRHEIFQEMPEGFVPTVSVSACYIEVASEILLLEQGATSFETGRWGVPAGKLEPFETPFQAAIRELYEETAIKVSQEKVSLIKTLYIRGPTVHYEFHLFSIAVDEKPEVKLSKEHNSYRWVPLDEARNLPLRSGALEVLDLYRVLCKQRHLRKPIIELS